MTRTARPAFAFGIGGVVGVFGGLVGLGGAEFRLPALVGVLGFTARDAVPVNLAASFVVLAAAFPFRAVAVPLTGMEPHLPAILGMLAGSLSAAWLGADWLRGMSDRLLGRLILVLLVALGAGLIAEGVLVVEPLRLAPEGLLPTLVVAVLAGVGVGLVSSLLGVAGGELIIPAFILLFGVEVKLAGSISILIGLPTIAVGLTRHVASGSVLRHRAAWRGTILPLAAGSVAGAILGAAMLGLAPPAVLKVGLGLLLIWSATAVFRHLPKRSHDPAPESVTLTATVLRHDETWGLTEIAVGGQRLTVPRLALPEGATTTIRIAARDVTLVLAPTEGTSVLNHLLGSVATIDADPARPTANVVIAVAEQRLVATVTRRSVAALDLREGRTVHAQFKATAVA